MQRARAALGVPFGAMLADPAAVMQQIRHHPLAPHLVNRLDQLREKVLDTAPFSLGSTRRSTRRALDTVATDLLANFPHVLGEIDFASHGRLLFKRVNRAVPRSFR